MKRHPEIFWILLISVVLILPFFVLSYFIQPSADDFVYSVMHKVPNQMSFWQLQYRNYMIWNGRYFSSVLLFYNPLYFGFFTGYKFIPVLLMLFLGHAIFVFSGKALPQLNISNKLIISVLFVLIYLNIIPSTAETLYWMSASLTYFLPCIFLLYLMSLLIKRYTHKASTFSELSFSCLLIFMIAGSNELSAVLVVMLMFAFVFLQYLKNHRIDRISVFLFVFSVALLIFVAISPGNTVRSMNYDNTHQFRFAIENGLLNTGKILILMIKSPSLLLALMLIAIYSGLIKTDIIVSRKKHFSKFFMLILSIFPVFVFYVISAYGLGLNPPLRLHGFVVFYLLCVFSFLSYKFGNEAFKKLSDGFRRKMGILLFVVFFISIIGSFHKIPDGQYTFSGNFTQAVHDLFYEAATYKQQCEERKRLLSDAKQNGVKDVIVPEISCRPVSIFFLDISEDATKTVNQGYADYYNFNSVLSDKNLKKVE